MLFNLREAAKSVLQNHNQFQFEIDGSPDKIQVEVYDGEFFIARFALSFIPANPHYVVGWGLRVDEDYQGMGIGQELLNLRMEIAEKAGAHTWLSTVNKENDAETHIMEKHGFDPVVGDDEDERHTKMWARDLTPDFHEQAAA